MIFYRPSPCGGGTWWPRVWTKDEALELQVKEFTAKFQALNPPPTPGTFKLTLKVLVDAMESNRWPCVGGPMDGEGIAKEISLNKGAGGKKLTVTFKPDTFIAVKSKDETVDGYYTFIEDKYHWVDCIEEVSVSEPDPWINQQEKEAFENE